MHASASTELFIVHLARWKRSSPERVEGLSRAMLATARPSCCILRWVGKIIVVGVELTGSHNSAGSHKPDGIVRSRFWGDKLTMGSFSHSILVASLWHPLRHARFPRDMLATSSRGCHEDATRKLLLLNFSYTVDVLSLFIRIFLHYHHSEILYTKLISVYIRNISSSQLCCLVLYIL